MLDSFIYDTFSFLVEKHNLQYAYQQIDYGRGFVSSEHSYYNDSGCFTISSMEQRGELDFYYAKAFSTERELLHDRSVNVFVTEESVWNEYGKIGIFPNIFFWWNKKRILGVLAKIICRQISNTGVFFDIKVTHDSDK